MKSNIERVAPFNVNKNNRAWNRVVNSETNDTGQAGQEAEYFKSLQEVE